MPWFNMRICIGIFDSIFKILMIFVSSQMCLLFRTIVTISKDDTHTAIPSNRCTSNSPRLNCDPSVKDGDDNPSVDSILRFDDVISLARVMTLTPGRR